MKDFPPFTDEPEYVPKAWQEIINSLQEPQETLRVFLYGGPGTGKSTTAAAVFAELKQRERNVESVHEFAKDLTWEGHSAKLAYQPYVAAKQMWWYERLEGKVEALVTDTSPLLSLIYGSPATPEFRAWLISEYHDQNHLSIILNRDPRRAYNTAGRTQTKTEAEALDHQIRQLLIDAEVPHRTIYVDQEDHSHVGEIANLIEKRLNDSA